MLSRAFSLLETMITVAIVGVLASIAAVSMSDVVGNARLRSDSDAIDDVLRRARNLARLERRCVQAVTTASRLTTTPLDHSPHPPPPDCAGGRLQTERRVVLDLPRGLRLSDTAFIFDRSGGVLVSDSTRREGGGVDIVATVADGLHTASTFHVSVLAGSGAVVRRQ